jgi:2-polyprenyl-3-methyl-5-hydroxy-6-metoxy-1,4-benzoquinol methylase
VTTPLVYWEERARRFAAHDGGLQAVCSYGMPAFYNRAVDLSQRRALSRWLEVAPGTPVLDVGCGVGRWSLRLARRGADVTGADLSPTMLAEASRRAAAEGLDERCRFVASDLASLDLGRVFPVVLGVTVLQHITDPPRLQSAVEALVRHVAPAGRLVLLEAAPSRPREAWNHGSFRVRSADEYLALLESAGLERVAVSGVDALPLKILFLPWYRRLPRPLGLAGLAVATALSLPVERVAGRRWVEASWHKVLVLRRPGA